MGSVMEAVGQKLARVEEHVHTLREGFQDFLDAEPYGWTGKPQPDGYTISYKITEVREPFPVHLSPLIGESLYHLRSTLDYIALGLAVACGAKRGKIEDRTQFPITSNFRSFCAAVEKNLPGLSDDAIRAVESLQPYNRWEPGSILALHPMRNLRDLSNIDKHRQPVVVATAVSWSAHADPLGLDCDMAYTFRPVKLDAEIARLVCDKPIKSDVNMEPHFGFRITFSEVRVYAGGGGGIAEEIERFRFFIETEVVPRVAPWFLPKFFI